MKFTPEHIKEKVGVVESIRIFLKSEKNYEKLIG